MTLSSIENIYNEYKVNFNGTSSFTIDFYKNNSVYLNNITTFQNTDQFQFYIELIWQYLNAKYEKCHYNDIVDLVSQKRDFWDAEIKRLGIDKIPNDWFSGIIGFYGYSSYHLNDYKTAVSVFKDLSKDDYRNDNYKKWLGYSRYGKGLWLSRIITIACGLIVVLDIFFGKQLYSSIISVWVVGIGFTGLLITLGYDYYIKRNFRKIK